eukprot:363548_1
MATSANKNPEEVEKLRQAFNKKTFTMEEVSKHNTEESPWVVVYGGVYDMTNFQLDHPGGPDVLQDIAGQDGTEEFENILHTVKARTMGHKYLLGSIEGADFDKWLENMNTTKSNQPGDGPNYIMILIVILAVILGVYYFNESNNSKQ